MAAHCTGGIAATGGRLLSSSPRTEANPRSVLLPPSWRWMYPRAIGSFRPLAGVAPARPQRAVTAGDPAPLGVPLVRRHRAPALKLVHHVAHAVPGRYPQADACMVHPRRVTPNYAHRNTVCVIGHLRHFANWPFPKNYAQRKTLCAVSRRHMMLATPQRALEKHPGEAAGPTCEAPYLHGVILG